MIKFALTGNIASGKSTAEEILRSRGYKVLDADDVAHNILDTNYDVKEVFAGYDIFEGEKISRNKLGKLVFSDLILKKKLEDIIHPLVIKEIINFCSINSGEKAVFVAVPLLFEAQLEYLFDKIILIYADDDIRLNRLIKRNGYSEAYAKKRMECQQSQDAKIYRSDYVVYNNSSPEELACQLFKIIE